MGQSNTGDDSGDGSDEFPDDSDEPEGERPDVCGGETITVAPDDPRIMLVMDKSESMGSHSWDHDRDPATPEVSRWHSLHRTTESILDRHGEDTAFGAVLFPSIDPEQADQCTMLDTVDVPVSKGNKDAILGRMPPRGATPLGGTPASTAIQLASDHLMGLGGGDSRSIVLVTDGAANCMAGEDDQLGVYDEDLMGIVEDALAVGIKTYVVGIDVRDEMADRPQVNAFEKLNEIAEAGGAAFDGPQKFYNAADEAELGEAVDLVTERVNCTLDLNDPPPNRSHFFVTIDGVDIEEIDDCEAQDGFTFTSDDRVAIELCNMACDRFTAVQSLETEAVCVPQG